jgi:hypothetical protein
MFGWLLFRELLLKYIAVFNREQFIDMGDFERVQSHFRKLLYVVMQGQILVIDC